MQTFNNESMILENFMELKTNEITLFGDISVCEWLHKVLTKGKNKKEWINSAGKSDPPPDFYNNKYKLMMDVMRIDDHAYIDKKNRIQNKTLQHESELFKIIDKPEMKNVNVFVIGDTKLPTNEDHNYDRYCKNFERVFKDHEKKLDLYQTNHPGFKSIFFIFDESSAYMENIDANDIKKSRFEGEIIACRPHLFCLDKKFVDIIKKSKVDYVIWYAPWKLMRYLINDESEIFPLPKCAIYDVKNLEEDNLLDYNDNLMISSEV